MIKRFFISTWVIKDEITHDRIMHPILEWVEANDPTWFGAQGGLTMFYPDADLDGKPDMPLVIILAKAEGSELETMQTLPGVNMIPAGALDANMNNGRRNAIKNATQQYGIPDSAIDNASNMFEVIVNIITWFNPSNNPPNIDMSDTEFN